MNVSERAEEIFNEAYTLDSDTRIQFVATACGADEALHNEVRSLLEASEQSEDFFDNLAGNISLPALAEKESELPVNKLLGQWRLLKLIGRGGMGSVYLAERADGEFEKRAALKILPFGVDGEEARSRFRSERQILARLVHENVARLLDGGVTEDGTPYFVMDYVDGLAIDSYCEEESLSLNERLQLILSVAGAVQFAHQNLVIHRDLKPSNVLVEEGGRVRLLDFGIAKNLEPTDTVNVTQMANRPVTPAFASPEMLRGDEVDVSTDVYSLGALMYLLLTGKLPRSVTVTDVAKIQSRTHLDDVPKPSSLNLTIASDLDAIVGKALANDPTERYSSMEGFANDLRRYLGGLPVTAKSPSTLYRLRKFIGRHKIGLTGAAFAITALIVASIVAFMQSLEAGRQRDVAVIEQQRIQATNEFYGLLLEEMGPEPFTSIELLDRGASLLEQQFGVEEAFMGQVLFDVSRRYSNLNERSKQRTLLHQAESLARRYNDKNLLAAILCRLPILYAYDDPELAKAYSDEGNAVYAELDQPRIEASIDCLRMNARDATANGDIDGALSILHRANDILDEYPIAVTSIRAPLLNEISFVHYNAGQSNKSIEYLAEIQELLKTTGRGNTLGYLKVTTNLAVVLGTNGRLKESLATYEEVAQSIRDSDYERRGAASFLNAYGSTLARVGRIDEAETAHREGITAAEIADDDVNIAANEVGLSRVYLANEKYEDALDSIDAALAYIEQNSDVDKTLSRGAKVMRPKILRNMGRHDEALAAIGELLTEVGYPQVESAPGLLSSLIEAAAVYQAIENYPRAEELVTDLISRLAKRDIGDPLDNVDIGRAYIHRAEIRTSLGHHDNAIEDLELGIPILSNTLGEEHKVTIDAQALLEESNSVRNQQPSN